MIAKLQSWWQRTKRPLEVAIIIFSLVILIALIIVVIIGYLLKWGWMGLSQKTLWDWLQLLIIPVVLAVGGYLFNYTTTRAEQRSTQLRDQTEQAIASDNQREAALQAYIDSMSELLLHEKLRESEPGAEVRNIARVRTLTILPRLDANRKRSVLQFLHESGLIEKGKNIIDLSGADLNKADLSRANLSGAGLSKADLRDANLSNATLSGATLSNANLLWANLYYATLSNATLSGALLSFANLFAAKLIEADLSGANLGKVNLSTATLSRADLSRANLREANLSATTLSEANLSGADLSDTDLREANLSGADLSGADLSEANLSGASLKGAVNITTEELENQAKSLKKAIMPDGLIHP